MPSNFGKACHAVYTPNNMRYEHGDVWGAGMCPYQGKTPGKKKNKSQKVFNLFRWPAVSMDLYKRDCIFR